MIAWDAGQRELLGLRGRCGTLRVDAAALHGNPLGDPTTRYLPVYVPPGVSLPADDGQPATTARLPVLYYLPAYGALAAAAAAAKPWEPCFFQRVDSLIAEEAITPFLVVAVDAWTRLGGSQYTNSSGLGAYAQAFIENYIPAVEAALPARTDAAGRVLIGKSSGGFGALHLTMEYPQMFGHLAALSADGYFPYSVVSAFPTARREINKAGSVAEFVAGYTAGRLRGAAAHETCLILAYGAAYCTRVVAPYAFDLPFDLATGALDPAVFAQWQAFDPVQRVTSAQTIAGLRELQTIYLDCGDHDEHGLDVAARLVAQALRTNDVAVTYEEYAGGHRGNAERFSVALRCVSAGIRAGR